MAFCENCGTKIDDDAKFCEKCGTPIEAVQSAPTVRAAASAPVVTTAQSVPAVTPDNKRDNVELDEIPAKKKNILPVVVGAVVAVALAVVVVSVTVGSGAKKETPETLYKSGIDAMNDEQYDYAIIRFNEAIGLDSNYADAYFNRGLAYNSKKDYDKAIENFNKTIELNPNDWQAYKSRGGAYYDKVLACMKEGGDYNDKKALEYSVKMFADFNNSIKLNPNYTVKPPETSVPQKTNGEQLNLTAIINNSVIALGAKGGWMPSIFYKEYHRYVSKEQDFDTIIEYVPGGPLPKHPKSGRNLTVNERYEICLYMLDENRNVVKSEGKPLSAYDELKNRLMKVKENYRNAKDGNDIIIAVEDGVHYEKIIPIVYAARIAGFPNISLALLGAEAPKESPQKAKEQKGVSGTVSDQIKDKSISSQSTTPKQSNEKSAQSGEGRRDVSGGYGSGYGNGGGGIDGILGGLMGGSGGNHDMKKSGELKVSSPDFMKGGALTGGRSRASIQRVIMQNMAALRYAYNRRLRDKPGLAGTINVKFAIDEFGKVISAQMVESTMNDSELERTVVDRVKSWNFDKIDKPGDVTEVVYPFVFSQ